MEREHADPDEYEKNPEEYERQCLEALQDYYHRPQAAEGMKKYANRVFLGARLEGRYPDTRLIVTYRYEGWEEEREVSYRLWSDAFVDQSPLLPPPHRFRWSPTHFVDIITADLDAPGEPLPEP